MMLPMKHDEMKLDGCSEKEWSCEANRNQGILISAYLGALVVAEPIILEHEPPGTPVTPHIPLLGEVPLLDDLRQKQVKQASETRS